MDEAIPDDAVVEEVPEDGDSIHPKVLVNETPTSVVNIFYFVLSCVKQHTTFNEFVVLWTLRTYGWFILFGLIVAYLLYKRFQPRIASAMRQDGETDLHRYDMNEAYKRQEAMDAARRRLQENFNQQAEKFAEEQRRKEEEKRKAKLEDWDRHVQGKGYKSKYRPTDNDTSAPPSDTLKPKKKTTYRQSDYNPLTGEGGGSCSYRPSARGGGASGGG